MPIVFKSQNRHDSRIRSCSTPTPESIIRRFVESNRINRPSIGDYRSIQIFAPNPHSGVRCRFCTIDVELGVRVSNSIGESENIGRQMCSLKTSDVQDNRGLDDILRFQVEVMHEWRNEPIHEVYLPLALQRSLAYCVTVANQMAF